MAKADTVRTVLCRCSNEVYVLKIGRRHGPMLTNWPRAQIDLWVGMKVAASGATAHSVAKRVILCMCRACNISKLVPPCSGWNGTVGFCANVGPKSPSGRERGAGNGNGHFELPTPLLCINPRRTHPATIISP